jgi:diguanylate cyclase (GGDEF)-like protein
LSFLHSKNRIGDRKRKMPGKTKKISVTAVPETFSQKEKEAFTSIFKLLSSEKIKSDQVIKSLVDIISACYEAERCFVSLAQKGRDNFFCSSGEKGDYTPQVMDAVILFTEHTHDKLKHLPNHTLFTPDEMSLVLPDTESPELRNFIRREYVYMMVFTVPGSHQLNGNLYICNPLYKPKKDGFINLIGNLLSSYYLELNKELSTSIDPFADSMTGVRNANAFTETKLKLIASKPHSVGVVFADINGLKYTNDNYGHSLGDGMIISTAQALIKVFPKEDIYRVGGDEFVALSVNKSADDFKQKTNAVRKQFLSSQGTSASLGTSYGEREEADIVKLVAEADKEMYAEKNFYYDLVKQNPAAQDQISIGTFEQSVSEAIRKETLTINLIPRFEEPSGRLAEFDARITLLNPINSITDPTVFIETMEKIGYAQVIDLFMIKEVSAFQRTMLDNYGWTVPVSINFARSAIIEGDLTQKMASVADAYKIPHQYFNIQLIHLGRNILDELTSLSDAVQKQGFLLSLNHFGVGDANLAVFSFAHFNEVKLSDYFIPSLDNTDGQAVLRLILSLCEDLHISPCFDGITNKAEFEKAQKLGFREFRGPYLADEMTMKEAERRYYKKR